MHYNFDEWIIKKEPFQFTFEEKDGLYICIGYGQQERSGYSIAVNALYLTDGDIRVNTNLLGPETPKRENEAPSCPYIVLKTELLKQPVTFE